MGVNKYNSEGYNDPTVYEALTKIVREGNRVVAKAGKNRQRQRENRKNGREDIKLRPKVYVVSKYAGDIEANVSKTVEYCRFVIAKKRIPVASHLIYPAMLNDMVTAERELGTMFGLALLALCDEVWVFGKEHSEGMTAEIVEAKRLNKPVRFYDKEVVL